jgi:hypothetical protein
MTEKKNDAAMSLTKDGFVSRCEWRGSVSLPAFSDVRVMMLPVVIGNPESLPDNLAHWRDAFVKLSAFAPEHIGQVGYLTIDEKEVKASETHRRTGLHVDGVYNGGIGGWGGGYGGGWGSVGNGMLTVSSPAGCRAYVGEFSGWPGNDGEAEHLREQLGEPVLFGAEQVFWVDGLCVHESVPMVADTKRAFVRLSLPSCAPWFEGYTENPKVRPTGPILPRRAFMEPA